MKKGTLKNGFNYEVDENCLDNMELVDAMAEAEAGNPLRFSQATLLLLGKDQKKALYDHLRKDDGRVPIQDVSDAFEEILQDLGEQGKN